MNEINMYVSFICIFVATFLRTYIAGKAAMAKAKKKGEEFEWDYGYTFSALFSVIVAFIVSAMVFTGFNIPDAHLFIVIMAAFAYGFTQTQILNQMLEWLREIYA